MDIRIISIGTLAINPLWDERAPTRTGHATTTLIQTSDKSGDINIVIDPGLPAQMVGARLTERSGLSPDDITHVFLTSFHPETRRGLAAFTNAQWLISPIEREAVGVPIAQTLAQLAQSKNEHESAGTEFPEDEQLLMDQLITDIELLSKIQPAPDSIAKGVDLFPLPGVSAGTCGILISEPTSTTLICGDAIPTVEHLKAGRVMDGADRKQATASFSEAIEIADTLVLGRDNLVQSPSNMTAPGLRPAT